MLSCVDQMGREVKLSAPAKRIISIVPSQTEYLCDLGLQEEVIGITKFCILPNDWFRTKERVGGTKNLDLDKIRELNPDLIIGNMEENTKADIQSLENEFPIYMSDVLTIDSAFDMMLDIGLLVGKTEEAKLLVSEIKEDFSSFPKFEGKVLYFMWKNPYMTAGKATFIGKMIEFLGFTNLYEEEDGRYKEISDEEIKESPASLYLLSTEPFPFKENDVEEFQNKFSKKAIVVDGEMFSWYGSRMKLMKAYFSNLKARIDNNDF
ncbi:MAG: helical backbone metal receptor [Crocinitomicaceae bacterium]|nr:helical backbone metal receptor [Crocinitomicaceae bacterium]